jgi:very-short-patch-repair endonuclease
MKYHEIKEKVRQLRKEQTLSEQVLWEKLRNRKLDGFKFLRQYPVIYEYNRNEYFYFVVDFYCHEKRLVIEPDGKIHEFQKEKDHRRDLILKELSLKTIRIKNEQLSEINKVLERLREKLV